MRVLMFGWEFPPHISGGLGTACHGLTKGLHSIGGTEILFVVPKAFGDEDKNLVNVIDAGDITISEKLINYKSFFKKIHFIEIGSHIVPYTSPEEYELLTSKEKNKINQYINTQFNGKINFSGGYGNNLFQEIANYAVIASKLGTLYDFDVIHAHDWLTFPAGIAAKKSSGKSLIIHVHATEFDRSGGNVNPGVYEIERKGMHMADKIIAVSNLTRNVIIEKYEVNPEKVITVHNAVEPSVKNGDFVKAEGMRDKIVTFLGRVTMQKGPEYFIEAANKVLRKMNNVRFVMAGSGDMLNKMIHRVSGLRIGDRFNFTGFLQGGEVNKMFAISDVYVMPSVSEPFGISPLEALHSNVPVIISKQSGVSEILKHAIKIDFWDIDAMADAIYGIVSYKGLKKMFEHHGKTEVESLKWENTAHKVFDIYKSLV